MPASRTERGSRQRDQATARPHRRPRHQHHPSGPFGSGGPSSEVHDESATVTASSSTLPDHLKPQAMQYRSADGLPGLSKLKASIRQTRRFLSKEGLEPGLRIQTQRRLESLEMDLARAQRRDVEMKNGSKYHMINLFERQKLTRIIKRLHRSIAQSDAADIPRLEADLERARVMLHYVLQFPNSEKYISLFPPSQHEVEGAAGSTSTSTSRLAESAPAGASGLPPYLLPNTVASSDGDDGGDETSRRRLELLRLVRRLVSEGTLSRAPEADKGDGNKVDLARYDGERVVRAGGGGSGGRAGKKDDARGGGRGESHSAGVGPSRERADDVLPAGTAEGRMGREGREGKKRRKGGKVGDGASESKSKSVLGAPDLAGQNDDEDDFFEA